MGAPTLITAPGPDGATDYHVLDGQSIHLRQTEHGVIALALDEERQRVDLLGEADELDKRDRAKAYHEFVSSPDFDYDNEEHLERAEAIASGA